MQGIRLNILVALAAVLASTPAYAHGAEIVLVPVFGCAGVVGALVGIVAGASCVKRITGFFTGYALLLLATAVWVVLPPGGVEENVLEVVAFFVTVAGIFGIIPFAIIFFISYWASSSAKTYMLNRRANENAS